jgi:hypothetical protein
MQPKECVHLYFPAVCPHPRPGPMRVVQQHVQQLYVVHGGVRVVWGGHVQQWRERRRGFPLHRMRERRAAIPLGRPGRELPRPPR